MSVKHIIAAALTTCLLSLSAKAQGVQDSARYRDCLATVSIKPQAALMDAEDWTKAGGGAPALHCAALS